MHADGLVFTFENVAKTSRTRLAGLTDRFGYEARRDAQRCDGEDLIVAGIILDLR